MKNTDYWDQLLVKLSFASILLFIITFWNSAMDWIHTVKPWYFLLAAIILAIKPLLKHFKD